MKRHPLAYAIGATIAAVFGVALGGFALARPRIEVTFPRSRAEPEERHDLSYFAYGPTVRVSSVDWANRNHPAYAVDGVMGQPWVSAKADRAPWIEVALDRARDIDEVVLVGGAPHYNLECFAGDKSVEALAISSPPQARAAHSVGCRGADRVRLTFARPRPSDGPVAVRELEIWGR